MTIYEHVMLGVDGALAAGLHRRYGWQIVALSGCAAALPDWDGLTLLLGSGPYAEGHRVWGHSLLVAGLCAVVLGAMFCRWDLITRIGRAVGGWGKAKRAPVHVAQPPSAVQCQGQPRAAVPHTRQPCSWATVLLWAIVGLAAAYSHLAMDVLFSYGRDLPVWDVPLLWPFSKKGWAVPTVRWGDPVPTILFAAGMLAMARWRSKTQPIALGTLALVGAYIVVRGLAG